MPNETSEDLDLVMNSEPVMIGGTRVTFENIRKVQRVRNSFFKHVADKKKLK
jgi:hypothetical protein